MLLTGHLADRLADSLSTALPELATRTAQPDRLSAEDAAWADSYVGRTVPTNLARSGVRWVHVPAAGVERVVTNLPSGIMLTRTIGSMPRSIGGYVLAQLLAHRWRLRDYAAHQSDARWQPLPVGRVGGRSVVVLGTGEIGSGVGRVLRSAGYRVVGVNTRGTPAADFDDVAALADVDLSSCLALVNALPLTPATDGLIGASVLDRLRDAVVINVGRGSTIVTEDLRAALEAGSVARAVLDVFEAEPLPAEDWRWRHPLVVVTPHVSGPTYPEDVVEAIVECYQAFAAGLRPPHTADLGRGY